MRLLVVPTEEMPLADALARSEALLGASKATQSIVATAAVASDHAVVLGALQVASRVLDVSKAGRVLRRATTGTGFTMRGGLVVTIAMPYVDAAVPDATARSFLNRNVRLLLRGLARAKLAATYFGREWLVVERRPFAVVGVEVDREGALLVECFATWEGSLAIEDGAATVLERSCDRYRGKPTLPLCEAGVRELTPALGDRVLDGIVERLGMVTERMAEPQRVPSHATRVAVVTDGASPIRGPAELLEPRPIPIGYLDVARVGSKRWVGGDMLGPTFAFGTSDVPASDELPLEGAIWNDIRNARTS